MCNTKSNQYGIKTEQFQEFITELKCDDGINIYKQKIKKNLNSALFCCCLYVNQVTTEPLFVESLQSIMGI
jgi:hypothetical protein